MFQMVDFCLQYHNNTCTNLFCYSEPDDRPTAEELLQHPFVRPDPTFDFKESLKLQQLKH
jgi:hypothetical protein